jgi:HlyD family secretion protein
MSPLDDLRAERGALVRWFLIVFVLLIIGLAVGGIALAPSLGLGTDLFAASVNKTSVRVEPARRDRLVETVSAPGEIEPLTKVEISAEVSARIEALPFRAGDKVNKDDVLVRLDSRDLQAALDSAGARRDGEKFRLESERARLAGLLSTAEFAQRQMKRQEDLHKTGDVPSKSVDDAIERFRDLQSGLDAARFSISMIESSLAAAEADIQRAEEGLARTVMHSPIPGLVTQLNAEVGELVVVGTMNNPGTVIMTVADLSRMIMKARVAESDIARIEAGQHATLHINAHRDEAYAGTVSRVALQRTAASALAAFRSSSTSTSTAAGCAPGWPRTSTSTSTATRA